MGNPWEKHIQEDLTEERFAERYPQYKLLLKAANDYAYYTKDNEWSYMPLRQVQEEKRRLPGEMFPAEGLQPSGA